MNNNIFQESNVAKAYLKLSIPLILSMVVTLIYNLADTFFVTQTGDTNLVAGVSLGMPIFTLLMAIGNIFGQGGCSLISRMLGQKDQKGMHHVSSFSFYTTLIIGCGIGIFMLLTQPTMLNILGASKDTYFHANQYYTFLAIGAPALMLSFVHSNFLRSEGMSKESMMGTIFGALVNIVLDPICISLLGYGAAGAAIATAIGYGCADLFYLYIVWKRSNILSINPKEMRIPFNHVKDILGIGIPAAIVNIMQSVSVVFVNQFLLPYGNDKIASMGIALKVAMIALLLLTGFAFGGQPLFGYYYGAKDKKRLRALLKFCIKFIGSIALFLSAIIILLAPQLMSIFMNDSRVIIEGAMMLRWQVITMVFVAMILLTTIIFQSMGKATASFILSLCRQGVIFLVVLMISTHTIGYKGIIMSQAIADTITAIIALILYRHFAHHEFQIKKDA